MKLSCHLLFWLMVVACSPVPDVHRDERGNEVPEPFVAVGGVANPTDIARFLGGRPVRNGARLSRLQREDEYQAFSRDNLSKWKYRTSKRIAAQVEWSGQYLEPLAGTPRTVVYPFGGPDLLYVAALFPESSRYVMMGLEPVGAMPDLENTDPGAVISSLRGHDRAVETQLLHGYFITKDMKTDFSHAAWQGVTPVLLTAVGLMNGQDVDVRAVDAGGNPAVEIVFTLPGRGRKSVVYVQGDLSNQGFGGSYESWLAARAGSGSVAYFKAASYLLQDDRFSGIREFVLGRCKAVVQDDSGVPYRFFDQGVWDVHLFGRYTGPIGFFERHAQADLAAAYQAAGPRPPLTFGSGYQMEASSANLLIARRK
ncbi:MAG: hypothetical protein Q7R22_002440 [Verrucomicrobiota bacterium JB025]|nr:hypothetical protein [Verrucomicrobiota bacterium JB025]